eukprot:TRINITY_DN10453_c0_g1_i1.p1 TRINITY_DN10453_c0_g1~~TRINITY_DN10453_c0_g1_i1.p1  ORF type:complete len:157 (+),score=18.05 TRINITY_DN10453_c0_g1_i1:77-547(+)
MDLNEVTKRLNITDKAIIRKAQEYSRLCDVRAPSGLPTGQGCKNIVFLDIACSILQAPFDREGAMKMCGTTFTVYSSAHLSIQNLLQVSTSLSIESLCKKFKCPQIAAPANANLEKYKTKFLAGVEPHRRQFADFSNPVFNCAVFYLTAKKTEGQA